MKVYIVHVHFRDDWAQEYDDYLDEAFDSKEKAIAYLMKETSDWKKKIINDSKEGDYVYSVYDGDLVEGEVNRIYSICEMEVR